MRKNCVIHYTHDPLKPWDWWTSLLVKPVDIWLARDIIAAITAVAELLGFKVHVRGYKIMDECQRLEKEDSKLFPSLKQFHTGHHTLLITSPLQSSGNHQILYICFRCEKCGAFTREIRTWRVL